MSGITAPMSNGTARPLLDHGYLQVIDVWGSDQRIVEAARMSTDKGFLGWGPKCGEPHFGGKCGQPIVDLNPMDREPITGCTKHGAVIAREEGDEKLLRYLWKNKHQTPFEMAGLTLEVQAPIFVFREWHRHRVPFGYNELSARYTPMPNLNYVPSLERAMLGSDGTNKQAGTAAGADVLTEETAAEWLRSLEYAYEYAEQVYQSGLQKGLPKELARAVVPVGRYSRMRATGNLRGWLGFLQLRAHSTAQYEIRMYALALAESLRSLFPRTMEIVDTEGF